MTELLLWFSAAIGIIAAIYYWSGPKKRVLRATFTVETSDELRKTFGHEAIDEVVTDIVEQFKKQQDEECLLLAELKAAPWYGDLPRDEQSFEEDVLFHLDIGGIDAQIEKSIETGRIEKGEGLRCFYGIRHAKKADGNYGDVEIKSIVVET